MSENRESLAGAAVVVFVTNNVVFVQIFAGLNLNEFHILVGVVLNAVFHFNRNKNIFAGFLDDFVFAERNDRFAADNNPVLVAEVM